MRGNTECVLETLQPYDISKPVYDFNSNYDSLYMFKLNYIVFDLIVQI